MRQLPLRLHLPDHAVFASYFAGPNAAAVGLLSEVAAGRDEPVVMLWGGQGAGKTHLLQAVCARGSEHGRRVGYLPLADTRALGAELLDGCDALDLVCLDDLHCIAGDERWEAAAFGLFNRLRERGATLLGAAPLSPAGLGLALPDLVSRLQSGPVFCLQELDDDDRCAALRLRASFRGLELPGETVAYMLRRWRRDMGSLYRLLDTLDEASLAAQRRLTVPFVRRIMLETRPTGPAVR